MTDDPQSYIQGVLARDRRVLAKTITLIESSLPAHQRLARMIIDQLMPYTGKAVRLGITGVPGAGKSTFIESLGTMLVQKGHQVAVLAVDPSSKRSGGSVLADKTRMEKLAVEKSAFIRPSPSGDTLGGVARKTRETMMVCESAGFDVMIVETVGVGQSETTVASMVDFFLVLMIAGAGDELQGIKKGILELADAVVVNKADGDNIERAEFARKQYESALQFLAPCSLTWTPSVLTCSALKMIGIDKIWEIVLDHRKKYVATGELETNRKKQAVDWMWSLIKEDLKERFYHNADVKNMLPKITQEVENGTTASTVAASQLLFFLDKTRSV
ncbi:MAG: methylmalonyl Co-A mutase-associated GTPase MeaB [Desulfobacterales bacterium]|nr:MAG: methylmalonyl Co-A mutase-associated GTPase MeaB [Desulfobacterales bacterium]UCD91438.1 MAG: methylmalonyl Co-A mutase-associated GTPase MeaB [Desulfobacterales bacterium]